MRYIKKEELKELANSLLEDALHNDMQEFIDSEYLDQILDEEDGSINDLVLKNNLTKDELESAIYEFTKLSCYYKFLVLENDYLVLKQYQTNEHGKFQVEFKEAQKNNTLYE